MTDFLDAGELPRRRGGHRRRRRGGARWVAVLFVLLLVSGLALGGVWAGQKVLSRFEDAPDYAGPGSGEAVVQVEPGDTAEQVATKLRDADVTASRSAFLEVARSDPRGSSLQPGFYRLLKQMSAAEALELLVDPSSRILGRVTVPEGYTVPQTLEALAAGTEIPLADYEAAAKDPAAIGLPTYAGGNPEGFLFPATYDVEPGMTAVDVLRLMVQRFDRAAADLDLEARAAALGLSPYEAVVVASLIEREVKFDDEYGQVARVVYNRLEQGIPLGIDAAVAFGVGKKPGEALTKSDLAQDTPYENRRRKGLPPTPIASPGEATLRGALEPSEGDILYYVLATKEGRTFFTADYQEFLRQKEKSQREGIF